MNLDIFSNQILLELTIFFLFIQMKVTMLKDLMREIIIYQKA